MKNNKLTLEDVKNRIKEIHGNKYEGVDDIEYINSHTKIKLICPKHGEFYITPRSLFKGCGCRLCSNETNAAKSRSNVDEFVKKAREIHNNKYDYSKVNYVNTMTKVCIICPEHGEFWQTPSKHLYGQGCPKCSDTKLSTEDFVKKCQSVHGNKYMYDKVNYVNNYTPVTITCPEHGDFEQIPYVHLNRHGNCPKCRVESAIKKTTKTQETFIKEIESLYGDTLDFSNTIYNGAHNHVNVMCHNTYSNGQEHGEFNITPSNLLRGQGCPKCARNNFSKQEREVSEFLKEMNLDIVEQYHDKYFYEIDMYLPSYNIGIEFDGLYWHCDSIKSKNFHLDKTNKCLEKGIRLIHIFEDEWLHKKDIVKSRLKNIIGLNNDKIFARKCIIKEVSSNESNLFLEENHLQGKINSSIRYGLYFNNELISLMCFTKLRKNLGLSVKNNSYEMIRYCNKLNTSVVGGASKLLKHFIKEHKPTKILSYADKRWSDGHLYETLGFTHTHDSKPNYFYIVGHHRENRFKYRKDVLIKQGFDKNKSETEIMKERGFKRIYDCGSMVFEYNLK